MRVTLIVFAILAAIFFFSSLNNQESNPANNSYQGYSNQDYPEQDYSDQDYAPDVPVTSDNWNCTSDCSGHEAGYEWASEHGIAHPDDCGGKSNSFIEGCQAYANEQIDESGNYDYEYDYGY